MILLFLHLYAASIINTYSNPDIILSGKNETKIGIESTFSGIIDPFKREETINSAKNMLIQSKNKYKKEKRQRSVRSKNPNTTMKVNDHNNSTIYYSNQNTNKTNSNDKKPESEIDPYKKFGIKYKNKYLKEIINTCLVKKYSPSFSLYREDIKDDLPYIIPFFEIFDDFFQKEFQPKKIKKFLNSKEKGKKAGFYDNLSLNDLLNIINDAIIKHGPNFIRFLACYNKNFVLYNSFVKNLNNDFGLNNYENGLLKFLHNYYEFDMIVDKYVEYFLDRLSLFFSKICKIDYVDIYCNDFLQLYKKNPKRILEIAKKNKKNHGETDSFLFSLANVIIKYMDNLTTFKNIIDTTTDISTSNSTYSYNPFVHSVETNDEVNISIMLKELLNFYHSLIFLIDDSLDTKYRICDFLKKIKINNIKNRKNEDLFLEISNYYKTNKFCDQYLKNEVENGNVKVITKIEFFEVIKILYYLAGLFVLLFLNFK